MDEWMDVVGVVSKLNSTIMTEWMLNSSKWQPSRGDESGYKLRLHVSKRISF